MGIYFGADTSREYYQCYHDQWNGSIVHSIKSNRLIITNVILHQSVHLGDVQWVYVKLQQLRKTYSEKPETFANATYVRTFNIRWWW